jgi:hypothetical protein
MFSWEGTKHLTTGESAGVLSWSGLHSSAVAPAGVHVPWPSAAGPQCSNSFCLGPVLDLGPLRGGPGCPAAPWLWRSLRPAEQRHAGSRLRQGSNPATWGAVPLICWRGGSETSWPLQLNYTWGGRDWAEVAGEAPRGGGGPGNGAVLGGGWGSFPAIRDPAAAEDTRRPRGKQRPVLRDSRFRTVSGEWTRDARKGWAELAPQLQREVPPLLNSCTGCMDVLVGRPFLVSATWLACSGTTPVTTSSRQEIACKNMSRWLYHHSDWLAQLKNLLGSRSYN